MKLRELLDLMEEVSDKLDVPTPVVCGGTCRDKYMGRLENIEDLDITNGTKSINYLSQEYVNLLKKKYNLTYKTAEDGHSTIYIGNLKIDFSSNFTVPNIEHILKNQGIDNPTDMQREIFSRDFTCNALLMSLDLKYISDPTERGFADIKEKKIRTCLSPEITLTSNRNRVIRAIYLAAKLDFEIDESIIEFVKSRPETVKISTPKSLNDNLNKAFNKNPEKTVDLLTKMNLWNHVPINEKLYPFYLKYRGQNVG